MFIQQIYCWAVTELAEAEFLNAEMTGGTEYSHYFEKDLFDLQNRYSLYFLIHNYFPPQEHDFVINLATSDT